MLIVQLQLTKSNFVNQDYSTKYMLAHSYADSHYSHKMEQASMEYVCTHCAMYIC